MQGRFRLRPTSAVLNASAGYKTSGASPSLEIILVSLHLTRRTESPMHTAPGSPPGCTNSHTHTFKVSCSPLASHEAHYLSIIKGPGRPLVLIQRPAGALSGPLVSFKGVGGKEPHTQRRPLPSERQLNQGSPPTPEFTHAQSDWEFLLSQNRNCAFVTFYAPPWWGGCVFN